MVVKKLRFFDEEFNNVPSEDSEDVTEVQKTALKRYFSEMVDQYPKHMALFVRDREKAKRLRLEADEWEKKAKKAMDRCFGVYEDEPLQDV